MYIYSIQKVTNIIAICWEIFAFSQRSAGDRCLVWNNEFLMCTSKAAIGGNAWLQQLHFRSMGIASGIRETVALLPKTRISLTKHFPEYLVDFHQFISGQFHGLLTTGGRVYLDVVFEAPDQWPLHAPHHPGPSLKTCPEAVQTIVSGRESSPQSWSCPHPVQNFRWKSLKESLEEARPIKPFWASVSAEDKIPAFFSAFRCLFLIGLC